ncbi:MAG: family transcriptional regulator, partial [Adhaeribacter sp.]|nr:family transcriptional regulator [Adhaeribacter sp.]
MSTLLLKDDYIRQLNNIDRKKYLLKIKIIKYLYIKGAKSNTDICYRFNISSPTSMTLINELMAEGLVEKQGRGNSLGGRKPDLYGLRDNSLFVLSISMERFKSQMAIFDNNNNNITGTQNFPIPISEDLSAVDQLYDYASKLITSSNINLDKLMGI